MDKDKPDSGEENTGIEEMQAKRAVSEETLKWNDILQKVAARRDRQAFRQLFEHFAPLIKTFAYKTPAAIQNEAFADELVQETMLKIWNKAASFDPSRASASTWIFTIARNTRIDLLRKNSRHDNNTVSSDILTDTLETQDIWPEESDNNEVFNHLAQERNKQVIQDSLKELPQEQSHILEKVYLEDKSHSEVAEELTLPLGTVKSRVRLALKKLRIAIDR